MNVKYSTLEDLVLRDLFLNSMEIRESSLTITIEDLIFVYNNLVEKSDILLIAEHEDDPIEMLLDALGNKVIQVQRNERQLISPEVLKFRMNLEIRCRLLVKHE
jgi:hypothetical protein